MKGRHTVPNHLFEPKAEAIAGLLESMEQRPVSVTIDGEEEIQDRIILNIEDLTKRFPDGYNYRFKPSGHKRSKWQMWLVKVQENLGRTVRSSDDLTGGYYLFQFEDWKWSADFVAQDVPVIVKEFNDREAALAWVKETLGETVFEDLVTEDEDRGAPEAAGKRRYRESFVLSNIDGRTYDQFVQAVVAEGSLMQDSEFLSLLVSQDRALVAGMVDSGKLSTDEDGTYHVAD